MLKVLRWIIFGAVVSLLPLAFAYLDLRLTSKPAALENIIGGGELLVIVWVLSATALGELFGSGRNLAATKLILGGLLLIVILLSGHEFAAIAQLKASNIKIDEAFVVSVSVQLFLYSLVPAVSCVAITEIAG